MMNEKQEFFEEFNKGLHRIGRVMMVVTLVLLTGVPFLIAAMSGVSIDGKGFLSGLLNIGLLYIAISVVEFLIYTPMLGVGGSYLAFVTGNVTNMKIPCAMNARDIAGTKVGTPENEIISTISVATSAIVTTLVIVVGVILLIPLQPVLQSEVLAPAFDYVVPALFGALGLKYFAKSPKIAVLPVTLMSLFCIFVPSMIKETSILMIPSGAIALLVGFLLFKKGKI